MQIIGTSCRVFPWFVAGVALAAVVAGCTEAKTSKKPGPEADTTPPTVSSTTPANGATDVPVNQVLAAVFSEALRCDTVDVLSVQLAAGGSVEGTVTCNGANVTFAPTAPLAFDTTYTATLTRAIADVAGNSLAAAHTWTFTTAAEGGDTTPPVVISTTPQDGVSGVPVGLAELTATFSEPIDCDSVTTQAFELGDEMMLSGTTDCEGATVTFTPSGPLAYESSYTATLTTAIRDLAGNHLESAYAWSFSTVPAPDTTPPTVVETHPADEAAGVPTDVAILATFSEPMNAASVVDAFTVSRGGEPVSGSIDYRGAEHQVVFTPSAPLLPGTSYSATITTAATDVAGNHLEVAAIWYFTTATPSARILYSWLGDLFVVREDGTGTVGLAANGRWTESFAGVSPDGKIVYKLEGSELHSVSSDGSNHVTIVGGVTPLDFLGFSSHGRILYRMNGNLYAVNVDGTEPATLAATGDVEPLAYVAGDRVVFLRTTESGRSVESVLDDGTGGVTLDGTPNIKLIYFIGPNGLVYYYRNMSGAFPNDDVYAVAPDGTSPPVAIAATTYYNEGLVALAPDGTPIVTGCISVMCEEEILFPGGADVHLGRGGVRGVTAANRIVFTHGDLGELDISTSDTAGAGIIPVASNASLNEDVVGVHPDGHILYRTRDASLDLFAVLADGSGSVTLAATADEETFMGVSPDGWVVFEASGAGGWSLRAIRPDGSDPRTLIQSSYYLAFQGFSVTGKVVYVASDANGDTSLWIVATDGTQPVRLRGGSGFLTPEYFGSLP